MSANKQNEQQGGPLGIIGGSGFYKMDDFRAVETREVETPFGAPSAPLTFAESENGTAVFLPRHGERHQFLPSEVNYRANIWALKECGVRRVIAVSAAGSLREDFAPGHFAVPSEYFDNTKGIRARTFFGEGLIAHVSTARAACPQMSAALIRAARDLDFPVLENATYACVEGPRLGSRAESFFLRDAVKADAVGMTNVPEAFLAREAQMCYATLAIATDYDCWMDDPSRHVTVDEVIRRFGESVGRAKKVLARVLENGLPEVDEKYRRALDAAILTPEAAFTDRHRELLAVLRA